MLSIGLILSSLIGLVCAILAQQLLGLSMEAAVFAYYLISIGMFLWCAVISTRIRVP